MGATDHIGPGNVVLYVFASPASLSIMGTRLLFNMREAAEKGLNQGTSCPTDLMISTINIARNSGQGEEVGTREMHI